MKEDQLQLPFVPERTHGGRRAGAGRKAGEPGVSHVSRLEVSKNNPRLVTLKCASGLGSLRSSRLSPVLLTGIQLAQRDEFRIVHFSIQHNHLHLIVEADCVESLGNGMKGLVCRLARGANKVWGRKGTVFPERFHDMVLNNLRQLRNALRYVPSNHRKHLVGVATRVDKLSSADDFDGWSDYRPAREAGGIGSIVAKARCWMLCVGWKERYALIPVGSIPSAPRARTARSLS